VAYPFTDIDTLLADFQADVEAHSS
jgi:hypothetical protein